MTKELKAIHIINRVTLPLLILAVIYYVAVIIKPSLILHAQQTPFLFTGEFLFRFLNSPGGVTHYLSQFLMQFFNNNLTGTVAILAVLALDSILFSLLIKRVFGRNVLLLPYLLLICSLTMILNYYFPFAILIQTGLVTTALLLFARNSLTNGWGWLKFFVLYLMIYYFVGTGPALVFAVGTIVIFSINNRLRVYYKPAVIAITSVLIPYIFYYYIFNLNRFDAFLNFYPDLPVNVEYHKPGLFYVYIFLIPSLLFLFGIYYRVKEKFRLNFSSVHGNSAVRIVIYIFIGAVSLLFLKSSGDTMARNIVLCDYYNYTGSFNRTIEIALDSKDEYDIYMNLAYNRAIANLGEMTNRILDYPQMAGSQILKPDDLGPVYMMVASDYYFDLGYISQSQHCAYAVLAINPDNIRAKKRLVVTNILLGNTSAAHTYLKSISRSIGNRDFYKKYMVFITDPSLVEFDPLLSSKLKIMPDNFGIPVQMTERLKDLISRSNSNVLAYEFLQIINLLDHQLNGFMVNIKPSLKFYNQIPRIYEQAILMYFFNSKRGGLEEYPISDLTKQQFGEFIKTMVNSGNNKDLAWENLVKYSNTYMYYITYLSPQVTNLQIVKQTI